MVIKTINKLACLNKGKDCILYDLCGERELMQDWLKCPLLNYTIGQIVHKLCKSYNLMEFDYSAGFNWPMQRPLETIINEVKARIKITK